MMILQGLQFFQTGKNFVVQSYVLNVLYNFPKELGKIRFRFRVKRDQSSRVIDWLLMKNGSYY